MDKAVGARNVEKPRNSGGDNVSPPNETRLSDIGITKKQSSRFQQEAKLSEEDFDKFIDEVNEKGEELTQSALLKAARGPHVANNSCDNEWYTPEQYIKPFRGMVGKIDLDPASCEEANAVVKAKRFYSIDDDGLRKKWTGSVWLNPPYAAGVVETFIAKLINEIDSGNTTSAALLVNNATETRWFQMALNRCNACCFLASRIKFWKPGKSTNTPLQGQCVLYFGADVCGFADAYSALGVTLVRETEMMRGGGCQH